MKPACLSQSTSTCKQNRESSIRPLKIDFFRMKNKHNSLLILMMVLFLGCYSSSCVTCIKGNGHIYTETKKMPVFNAVSSVGSFDIVLIPDTIYQVRISADKNLMQHIKTFVKNERLEISIDELHCFRDESISIEVRTPTISDIDLSGSGVINGDGFNIPSMKIDVSGSGKVLLNNFSADTINVNLSGSGKISLQGKTKMNNSTYNVDGSGEINAGNLLSDKCHVSVSGSGNVYAFVDKMLNVSISGSGNVYYYTKNNDLSISSYVSGSGSLHQEDKKE
jgi:hypothetical protein